MKDDLKNNILIIEDEKDIQEMLSFNFRQEGYFVDSSFSGEEGLKKAIATTPDLIILDIMLPGLNGINVCQQLRNHPDLDDTKIIMLSAKSEEADVVNGFEVGADDYVTKPFSYRILLARTHALLRSRTEDENVMNERGMEFNGLFIHPGKHEVKVDGEEVQLTFTEFKVLVYLASRPGWVFSKKEISEHLHGPGHKLKDNTIDFYVGSIRKKLKGHANRIDTVRGTGIRFRRS